MLKAYFARSHRPGEEDGNEALAGCVADLLDETLARVDDTSEGVAIGVHVADEGRELVLVDTVAGLDLLQRVVERGHVDLDVLFLLLLHTHVALAQVHGLV